MSLALVRFPIAATLGLIFSGIIFWFLAEMIDVHFEQIERHRATKIEFTRLRRDSDVKTIRREKPQLQKPSSSGPVVPQIAVSSGMSSDRVTVDAPVVDARSGIAGVLGGGMGVNVAGSDRDVIPLVRIEPDYPQRAASRGVQGWVVVEFTITPAGTVRDPKVVDGQPPGMFDQAAIKAVERWKYNPKVENGVAVERRGVQVMLTFKLEK